jgi:hypothetical protein
MVLLLASVVIGCSDLGVQLGSDSDKANAPPAYMNPDADDQAYDPALEVCAQAYNRNYSFWQTNYKALVESLGGRNVLETRNAYEQGRKNLTRMSKFLTPADNEKLMGHVSELDRIYESIRRGVANRATEMRLAMLERQIRGSFEPGVAQLVALPKETPPTSEQPLEKPEPEGRRETPPAPLIGFGEKVAQRSVHPDIATDMVRYRTLFAEWQSAHAEYMSLVRKDGKPGCPESLAKLLEALRAMRLLVRDERKANYLQRYISEYERLRAEAEQTKSTEKLLRHFDSIEKDVVARFAP